MTLRSRTTLVLAITVALGAVMMATPVGSRPETRQMASGARRVVLFTVPTLTLEDLDDPSLPNLHRLKSESAVAMTAARTYRVRPNLHEAFATISAGARMQATVESSIALDADAPIQGGTADELAERNMVAPVDGTIILPFAAKLHTFAEENYVASSPGALADAVHRGGGYTAAIGNADFFDDSGQMAQYRPVALAAMDHSGAVDFGDVSESLLEPDSRSPFGVRASRAAIVSAYDALPSDVRFVAIDTGDLSRVNSMRPRALEPAISATRARALESTDAILGDILQRLEPDDVLIVASPVPLGPDPRLLPTLVYGSGIPRGTLLSPGTRRLGLITLSDISATSLHVLGLPEPESMVGSELQVKPGVPDLAAIAALDETTATRDRVFEPLARVYGGIQLFVYAIGALLLFRMRGVRRGRSFFEVMAIAAVAYPLAAFVCAYLPAEVLGDPATLVGSILLMMIAITVVALWRSAGALDALRLLCAATVGFLLFDVWNGSRAQLGSLLGNNPTNAGRFFGFGNPAYAILASATIMWAALHVRRAVDRRSALVEVGCVFALVIVADGAPMLGADVGGLLTLFPIFLLTGWLLAGRRLRGRYILAACAGTLVLVALAAAIDLARPVDQQSHLGQFISDVREEGFSTATTTISRKVSANVFSYGSPWAWLLPFVLAYALGMLLFHPGGQRLLPSRSPERSAVIGALAVGVLGYAANDSGVVVAALALVYIAALLMLLASQPRIRAGDL